LFTVTTCVSVLPVAPSESVADTDTVELFVPSAKVHWKLPLESVNESDSATFEPVPEQLVVTEGTVS
jgi:hypothetical protein